MKDRKRYIEENRNLFDDKEPIGGHMERFESLLNAQEEKKRPRVLGKRPRLVAVLSVAASIVLLVGVAITFYVPANHYSNSLPTESLEEKHITDEFVATNNYYNQKMEKQINDIMCKLAHTDTRNQQQLTNDIEQIKENNEAFVQEMAKNENQEIAIHYLVKHYKTNIQILENINEKLGRYVNC